MLIGTCCNLTPLSPVIKAAAGCTPPGHSCRLGGAFEGQAGQAPGPARKPQTCTFSAQGSQSGPCTTLLRCESPCPRSLGEPRLAAASRPRDCESHARLLAALSPAEAALGSSRALARPTPRPAELPHLARARPPPLRAPALPRRWEGRPSRTPKARRPGGSLQLLVPGPGKGGGGEEMSQASSERRAVKRTMALEGTQAAKLGLPASQPAPPPPPDKTLAAHRARASAWGVLPPTPPQSQAFSSLTLL